MDYAKLVEGLSVSELKELETYCAETRKGLKDVLKSEKASKKLENVERANALIHRGKLSVGTRVLVSYKNNVVEGVVKSVPDPNSDNIKVSSDAFQCKDSTRYVSKENFVSLADEVEAE